MRHSASVPLTQDIWTALYYKRFPMNLTHRLTSSGAISANFYGFYHTSSLSVENYVAIPLLDYVSDTIETYFYEIYVILGKVFCSENIKHHHVVHDIMGQGNLCLVLSFIKYVANVWIYKHPNPNWNSPYKWITPLIESTIDIWKCPRKSTEHIIRRCRPLKQGDLI